MAASLVGAGCGAPPCELALEPGHEVTTCEGLTFDVTLPEACPPRGCGLLVDVHGLTMSAAIQDRNTRMGILGSQRGYVVVQPNAPSGAPGSSWDPAHDEQVRAFLERVIEAEGIDEGRVHMTGFSQGGFMSWRFACAHSDLVASVAPAAAGAGCPELSGWGCLFDEDTPAEPVDVLFLHGKTDALVDYESCAVPQRDSVVEAYGAELIDEDRGQGFVRYRYRASGGQVFELIEHEYENGHPILKGHCFPGSEDREPAVPGQAFAFACDGTNAFDWGREVLRFFETHHR